VADTSLLLKMSEQLNHFGPHLKHLILKNAFHGNFNVIFRAQAKCHLESLTITVEPELYIVVCKNRPQTIFLLGMMMVVPEVNGLICVQELFGGAAEKCVVEPQWVMRWVKAVWREQEAAVERLLESDEEEGPFDWEEDGDDDA
jgi:hypothetical protein